MSHLEYLNYDFIACPMINVAMVGASIFCEYSFYFQKVHVTLYLYPLLSLATQI